MAYETTTYPYDTVVMITDQIDGVTWQGSGVLISPDEVLTASHLVYIQGEGTASDIVVTPGYNAGYAPYGSAYGTAIHYNPIADAFNSISNQQSQFDYAVIHLSQPFPSLGYMGLEPNFTGGAVNVSGYPALAGGAQVTSPQDVTPDPYYTLLDGTPLGLGSSGGPVWVETASGPEVVGLVSTESYNDAVGYNVAITTPAYDQIEQWVAEDDGGDPGPPFNGGIPSVVPAGTFWQNADGLVATWLAGNGSVTGVLNPTPWWSGVGTGDLYGNGMSDVILQGENGAVVIWEMSGTVVVGGGSVALNPGSSWDVRNTGDFTADGRSDLVWQSDAGAIAIWEMNGTSVVGGGVLASDPGSSWLVAGTGDFYNDGNTDLLLQNNNGGIALWDMEATSIVQGGTIASNPGPTWRVVGTGDFYGDGNTDIVWQSAGGAIAIWDMEGTTIVQGGTVTNPGSTWHVVSAGDSTGIGANDLLLQNENGSVAVWEMSGTTIAGGSDELYLGAQWNMIGNDQMRFIDSGYPGQYLDAPASNQDEFVFTNFINGPYTITGFNPVQDVIEFQSTLFGSFTAVQAATSSVPGGALITLDRYATIYLPGVDPSSLHASNFALA